MAMVRSAHSDRADGRQVRHHYTLFLTCIAVRCREREVPAGAIIQVGARGPVVVLALRVQPEARLVELGDGGGVGDREEGLAVGDGFHLRRGDMRV